MQAGDDFDPEEEPEEEEESLEKWEDYDFDLGFKAGQDEFQGGMESDEIQIVSDAFGAFDEVARRERDEGRREKLEEALAVHAHYVIDVTKYVVPFTILVMVWHYTLPEWLGWLTEDQTNALAGFLIGGAGLGVVSTIFVYARNILRK